MGLLCAPLQELERSPTVDERLLLTVTRTHSVSEQPTIVRLVLVAPILLLELHLVARALEESTGTILQILKLA